jgi:hypothetical protein
MQGWGKKEKYGGGGGQRGDILTFTDIITDENISSAVIPSMIFPVKGSCHYTEIPV